MALSRPAALIQGPRVPGACEPSLLSSPRGILQAEGRSSPELWELCSVGQRWSVTSHASLFSCTGSEIGSSWEKS